MKKAIVTTVIALIAFAGVIYMWQPEWLHTFAKGDAAPKEAQMAASMPAQEAAPAETSVFIAPERQQLIGVKTTTVERKALTREIRTVGKVAIDETRVTHIHTKVAGYVEEVFVDFVGKEVKSGQPLFTIYSPELLATQEEYLLALKSSRSLKESSFDWVAKGSTNLLEAARKRLELWDMSASEIEDLERTGKSKRAITVYSPVSGVVTQRAAYHHGTYVTSEMELYTLVDLSNVWILGEVNESDLPYVRPGQTVNVEYAGPRGLVQRSGKVAFLAPSVDPKTRASEVRVEFSNPEMSLRPDMFVRFEARISLGSPLVVPFDAVLDTGIEQYVFVDKGQGYFEPRLVKVGSEAEGSWEILSGVKSGEQVVTSANFILDSESRLRGVLANMGKPTQIMTTESTAAPMLKVEIIEPRTAKVGANLVRLMVKDAAGNPIPDADVDLSIFMPQMGAMAPMRSAATLKPTGNGEYTGQLDVPMAWTWETTVTAKKSGKQLGSAKTNLTAR